MGKLWPCVLAVLVAFLVGATSVIALVFLIVRALSMPGRSRHSKAPREETE